MPEFIGSRPADFPGTAEEIEANWATHHFAWDSEDCRCWSCDCRPFGWSANWPCGAEIPRVNF